MAFKFHHDGGHGWLAVKRTLLEKLGIAGKITSFSYQKGATVYLEEDCDVATFFQAYQALTGNKPEIVELEQSRGSHPIRNYLSYLDSSVIRR